jgi:hypothetical protein
MANFLNIDSKIHKVRNRVFRVGVELEGGWDTTKIPPGTHIGDDGSVSVPLSEFPAGTLAKNIIGNGELKSPVLELSAIEPWMLANWPHAVNSTCGMHVHMSFHSALHYARLMKPEVTFTMVEYLRRWVDEEVARGRLPVDHHFYERLAGRKPYCRLEYHADWQASQTRKDFTHDNPTGHRYTVLSYAYSRFGTIECRVPPMMPTAEQGVRLVHEICAIVSALLVANVKREETKITAPAFIPEQSQVTETIILTV